MLMTPAAEEAIAELVRITSPSDNPIMVDLWAAMPYTTTHPIQFAIDEQTKTVAAGYNFDGPSIPRIFWVIAGYSPLDRDTLLASCIHDWFCSHPGKTPRVMADAWFVSVLSGATLNNRNLPQVSPFRAKLMYYAVRAWSLHAERKRKRAARKAATDNLTPPDKGP